MTQNNDDNNKSQPPRIAPLTDPAETVERVLSRRQLKIEAGDFVIVRTLGPRSLGATATIYELRHAGNSRAPERFTMLEHATARGDELATKAQSRLFYLDSEQDPPSLLKDARRS
jgi:hypothetical protein